MDIGKLPKTPAFWMPPEKHLVSEISVLRTRLAATVVENILYEQRFFMSDSKAVSDLFIASTGSSIVQKLISDGLITVARRRKNGAIVSLTKLNKAPVNELLKGWKLPKSAATKYNRFVDNLDIRTESSSQIFDLTESTEYFGNSVLALLNREYGHDLPS